MSAGVIAAHFVAGGITNYYETEVLADSPWGFWKDDDAAGPLLDYSGNSRNMAVTGSPTFGVGGPFGGRNAISWLSTTSQRGTTSATTNATVFTQEAWVYLTANPAAITAITARATGFSSSTGDGELYVNTNGTVSFRVFNVSGQVITTTTSLALNTWHHLVGSVGAAGMKLYVDGVVAATNPAITSGYGASSMQVFARAGETGWNNGTLMRTALRAYYTAQLSDARVLNHYLTGGGTAIIDSSITVIAPVGSTSANVECEGAGGAGGPGQGLGSGGGGGGGGANAASTTVPTVAGSSYPVTIGAAGTGGSLGGGNGTAGGDTTFFDTNGTTVLVRGAGGSGGLSGTNGGNGGAGGTTAASTGTTKSAGTAGSNQSAGAGGAGGAGASGASITGGGGGAGAGTNGVPGTAPGGGGGGGKNTTSSSGNGGGGRCAVSFNF